MLFVREKKVDCGDYREVDIIPRTEEAEKAVKGRRRKKQRESPPKQRELNSKNARRYLEKLANGNFFSGDLHVSLTYDANHLPKTREEAEKEVKKYLNKVSYRREKLGFEPLKYILVTEGGTDKDGNLKRIHHHILMNGGPGNFRDDAELLWTRERINWKKAEEDEEYRTEIEKRSIGYRNADRIQAGDNGISDLANYIAKDPSGKKRWSSSRNLELPVIRKPNDTKYTKSKVERLVTSPDSGREYFEKQYPAYKITEINPVYYEETGWHVYLKMWKKKRTPRKKLLKHKRKRTRHRTVKTRGGAKCQR